jgi:hypothetical protein
MLNDTILQGHGFNSSSTGSSASVEQAPRSTFTASRPRYRVATVKEQEALRAAAEEARTRARAANAAASSDNNDSVEQLEEQLAQAELEAEAADAEVRTCIEHVQRLATDDAGMTLLQNRLLAVQQLRQQQLQLQEQEVKVAAEKAKRKSAK